MADAQALQERCEQLLDLIGKLLAVGGAALGEEQQRQLLDLARQLIAVIRALLDLIEERLERAADASVQSECAERSPPHP
jgi:hypothetical protein